MKKNKIVIDTSVIISAFVFDGLPEKVIRVAFSLFEIYVSPQVLFEYKETPIKLLTESKINSYQFEVLIEGIATFVSKSILVYPKKDLTLCRDPKDNIILECCLAPNADFLVTGDKDLLEIEKPVLSKELQTLEIISPAKFLEKIKME